MEIPPLKIIFALLSKIGISTSCNRTSLASPTISPSFDNMIPSAPKNRGMLSSGLSALLLGMNIRAKISIEQYSFMLRTFETANVTVVLPIVWRIPIGRLLRTLPGSSFVTKFPLSVTFCKYDLACSIVLDEAYTGIAITANMISCNSLFVISCCYLMSIGAV